MSSRTDIDHFGQDHIGLIGGRSTVLIDISGARCWGGRGNSLRCCSNYETIPTIGHNGTRGITVEIFRKLRLGPAQIRTTDSQIKSINRSQSRCGQVDALSHRGIITILVDTHECATCHHNSVVAVAGSIKVIRLDRDAVGSVMHIRSISRDLPSITPIVSDLINAI